MRTKEFTTVEIPEPNQEVIWPLSQAIKVGAFITLVISGFIYAIISLFTALWWTGCIILFLYLWATITLYLWNDQKQQDE